MVSSHVFGLLSGNVIINTTDELVSRMELVVSILKLNEVSRAFHQFEPYGATGVIVLAESHFSAHTYPEDDKIYVDLFCCSKDFDPEKAANVISEVFEADMFMWEKVNR